MKRICSLLVIGMLAISMTSDSYAATVDPNPTLSEQLAKEDAAVLAKAAREQGDASRGAIVFHRPDLLCMRCHTAGQEGARLGPDLAKAGKEASDVYLI